MWRATSVIVCVLSFTHCATSTGQRHLMTLAVGGLVISQGPTSITIPKAYNDHDLSDWATPLRGLGTRPGFYSETEFDKIPAPKFYRTYPVYHPDHEPKGYWEWLLKQPPKPLLEPDTLRDERDWIAAGKREFHELYRGDSTDLIPLVRSRTDLQKAGIEPLPDGTLPLRWVVTPGGPRVAIMTCQSCHTRYLPDGTIIDGAPANHRGAVQSIQRFRREAPEEARDSSPSSNLEELRARIERSRQQVPWFDVDRYGALLSMTYVSKALQSIRRDDEVDLGELAVEERHGLAVLPRGGNAFFPTKTLDLNGVRHRKYLNHTATHLNRNVGDIMRYALNVECCDSGIFGAYRLRPEGMPRFRFPDDILFALATYIYSLESPPSPYRDDPRAATGKKIFEREACGNCHTPPSYTNNKLTLAQGFTPPADHPYKNDIMSRSVGTDPGRAMLTQVGTGFYRVPSLKGLWYRGLFGHSGDVASLEDWFDPARLRADYVPSGWKGFKRTRAVRGHEFGLKLPADEKTALIAFLKTL